MNNPVDNQRVTRADILAYLAVGSFIMLILLLFFFGGELNSGVKDTLLVISGALVVIVKDIYAFEFNSTRGSRDKDSTIAAMQREVK